MADSGRERMLENLVVSSAIGFMAVLLAVASIFVDSASVSRERAAILAISGGAVENRPSRFDDPAFSRVHSIRGGSHPYAAVLSLPAETGAVRAVVLFKRDGAAESMRAIGGKKAPSWLAGLVGAASTARSSSICDPSISACEDALDRASRAVASLGGAAR